MKNYCECLALDRNNPVHYVCVCVCVMLNISLHLATPSALFRQHILSSMHPSFLPVSLAASY